MNVFTVSTALIKAGCQTKLVADVVYDDDTGGIKTHMTSFDFCGNGAYTIARKDYKTGKTVKIRLNIRCENFPNGKYNLSVNWEVIGDKPQSNNYQQKPKVNGNVADKTEERVEEEVSA